MGDYLKHGNGKDGNGKDGKQSKAKKVAKSEIPASPVKVEVVGASAWEPNGTLSASRRSLQHDINHVAGLSGIEESLDWLCRNLGRVTDGEHTVGLSIVQGEHSEPIQFTLSENKYDDTLDRLVTAFERLADSVAKLAGLSRPRLEQWHEQADYTPRFKDSMGEHGAPGPKAE